MALVVYVLSMTKGSDFRDLAAEAVRSLDGHDDRLLPYLPYLLQDLWAIGTCPEIIRDLLAQHTPDPSRLRVLDLGCGKGAVAVTLASRLGCHVEGIDAIPAFIEEARRHAERLGVTPLCHFAAGDLRVFLAAKQDYDVAVWGAVGPVLGSLEKALTAVRRCVRSGGLFVIDDAYVADGRPARAPYLTESALRTQFTRTGWAVIEERQGGGGLAEENAGMTEPGRTSNLIVSGPGVRLASAIAHLNVPGTGLA